MKKSVNVPLSNILVRDGKIIIGVTNKNKNKIINMNDFSRFVLVSLVISIRIFLKFGNNKIKNMANKKVTNKNM